MPGRASRQWPLERLGGLALLSIRIFARSVRGKSLFVSRFPEALVKRRSRLSGHDTRGEEAL